MLDDKKILLVEDDPHMLEAMKTTINGMGIGEIDVAHNGRVGYEKAISKQYDLIISDMRMPDIDGRTMLEMLRVTGIDTPLCFVTAHGTVSGAVDALKAGAMDYILKPFPPEALEELICRSFKLLANGTFNCNNTTNQPKGIYKSAYMAHLFSIAKDIAETDSTVLITGESGTGKEVLARFIHEHSNRAGQCFVAVNCAAIPENLIESEFFGYEKGAFTGAVGRKLGKFELANNSTLLLDEIGEIPLHMQPKLLRVLQEREIQRLGGEQTIKIDTRIIATTNRNLQKMSKNGEFREDLFFRLNVINLELPTLKDRLEDLPDLVEFFVDKYSKIHRKNNKQISKDAMETIMKYSWPGNVRELEHTIERAVVLAKQQYITTKDLFLHGITFDDFKKSTAQSINDNINKVHQMTEKDEHVHDLSNPNNAMTIADMERELILNTLKQVNLSKTKAATQLGITVRTLRNKLNEYKQAGTLPQEYLENK